MNKTRLSPYPHTASGNQKQGNALLLHILSILYYFSSTLKRRGSSKNHFATAPQTVEKVGLPQAHKRKKE